MNFKLTSLIFFFALFLTSAFAAGYSDTVIMDQNNFDIQFYNCGSDSKCSNPTLVRQAHVNGTRYTFNYNTNNYYAEYIFKDGYLAKGFIVHRYSGTNTYTFNKKNNCIAPFTFLVSKNTFFQGENVSINGNVRSAFSESNPGTPNYKPAAYTDFFNANTQLTLQLLKDNNFVQEFTQFYNISMGISQGFNFQFNTSNLNGTYSLRLASNVIDPICNQNNAVQYQDFGSISILFNTTSLQEPIADAGSDRNVCASAVVFFNAANSYDLDGNITNYLWNFGDGNTAAGINTNHNYTNIGVYNVSLVVTDNDNLQDQDNLVVTVNNCNNTNGTINQEPVANAGPDRTVYIGDEVLFNNTLSYDPDGLIITYQWNFGDGISTEFGLGINAVSHIYYTNGTYNVTLTVTDDDNATNTDYAFITILNNAGNGNNTGNYTLSLDIDADPIYGYAPLEVEFSSDVAGNGPFNYSWDFDDGYSSTQANPTHTFTQDGIYDIELEVTDKDGYFVTDSITITVNETEEDSDDITNNNGNGEHRLYISYINLNKEEFYPGDKVNVNAELMNTGGFQENNIILDVQLQELGLSESSPAMTLSKRGSKWQLVELDLPEDIQPGLYNLKVQLYNNHYLDTKYLTITVREKNNSKVLLNENKTEEFNWLPIFEIVFLALLIVTALLGIFALARKLGQNKGV